MPGQLVPAKSLQRLLDLETTRSSSKVKVISTFFGTFSYHTTIIPDTKHELRDHLNTVISLCSNAMRCSACRLAGSQAT